MNDDDADLGSGSGFHEQCKSKQPLLKGVKNPISMMGVHNPFQLAIRALTHSYQNADCKSPSLNCINVFTVMTDTLVVNDFGGRGNTTSNHSEGVHLQP